MMHRIGASVVLLLAVLPRAAAADAAAARPARAVEERVPVGYQVLTSEAGSFVIFYPPHLGRFARETEKLLEESAGAIAGELGLETISPITVVAASDGKTYELLHGGAIPEWGIAFANVDSQVLGINVDLVDREPRRYPTVLRHELSHLLLAQRVGGVDVPSWFMEGLAMLQSGEWGFSNEWRFMTLAGRRELPYLEELRGPFPRSADRAALSYGISYYAVRKLLGEHPGSLATLTAYVRDAGSFESGFESTYGQSSYTFAGRLYVEIDARYRTAGAILNAAPYWGGAALLFVAVYLVKRERTRRKLERWAAEEGAERRIWY